MKNAILLVITLFTLTYGNSQNGKTERDTTKIKLGNKTIIIIEKNSNTKDTTNKIEDIKDQEVIINKKDRKAKSKKNYNSRAYSRWAGLYLGINQLRDIRDGGALTSNMEIWTINPWKSRIWNINFMELNINIVKRHILLTTGFGLEYKNFSFTNNINLVKDSNGSVDPAKEDLIKYTKDKLHISYFQMPLLLELNTSSKAKKGFYLAAGLVAGVKIHSKLYQNFELEDRTIKRKIRSDFNINPYQLYGTLRLGFNKFTIYSNFDILPLFKDGDSRTGDNLMAVSAGIKLLGF